MANLRSKTVLVYDYGQFVELAITLSKDFGRTLYYAPWACSCPGSSVLRIGDGIEGVERVSDMWEHIKDVDLVVFPDVYEAGLQKYLVSIGKRVWGCRDGAELELDRAASKEKSKALGIDVPPYKVITGLQPLRLHLENTKDQFVKISTTRGDMETFHSPDYAASEQRIDELEHSLGAKKKIMDFIVESGINPAVEVGYDGYTIDGKFPKGALVGVETKDKAYVGRTMRYAQLPEKVRSVNEKLAPALKAYGSRCFMSTEIRCKGDRAYLIDPCMRCGSPPSELYQVMIENLSEIIWEGSDGVVIEPEYKAKYGAMVFLVSDWANTNWQHVDFPPSIRENVKLRNMTMIDGEYYVIPQHGGVAEIGAVVAMGDTAEEAINECKRIAKKVEGYQIEKPIDALDEAAENLAKILGTAKKETPLERKAGELRRSGQISDKQYDRMMARG